MNNLQADFSTAVQQVQVAPVAPRKVEVGSCQCLVVSASQTRREMLSDAALDSGWDTVVCGDAESALSEFRRNKFQLAFVDLDGFGAAPAESYRDLCQQLALDGNDLLLVACGHEGTPWKKYGSGNWVFGCTCRV